MRIRSLALPAAAAIFATFLLPSPSDARAQADDTNPIRPTELTEEGFRIGVYRPGGGGSTPSSSCTWIRHQFMGSINDPQIERVDTNGYAYRIDPQTGQELTLYSIGGTNCTHGLIWVPTSLTPRTLIPTLRAKIERTLPTPTPDISPPPEFGTYINLGIWLAITDPGIITERATAGPVWAQGQATLTGFDVDFGNGDTVTCDSIGVPIRDVYPDLDTFEQGPCGYTYTWPDQIDTYTVTITSTYNVTYQLSNGETGTLGNVNRSTTFPYQVNEIQTVGTRS